MAFGARKDHRSAGRLLGPGLIGLMLAGVLAGTMSTLAAKALAISSLFVRNVYRQVRPGGAQERGVFYARCTIAAVLVLGQLWLFTATLNAYLGGDESVVWPGAIASVACLALNLGLLRHLYYLEEPAPSSESREQP